MTKKKKREFYQKLKSGIFANMVRESVKQESVNNSKELYNMILPLTAQEPDVEQFWLIFSNSKNIILEVFLMSKGTINSAVIYPREVIKKVLSTQATAVIACHNHPSGDPKPSTEDLALTFQLFIALKSIGVTFQDHLIIGNNGYFSMADDGMMTRLTQRYNNLIKGS